MEITSILDIEDVACSVVITPRENIDENHSVIFQEMLRHLVQDERYRIVIDFTNVDYIASSAWGIIVAMTELVTEKGGFLRLCNINPNIRQFLTTVQIDEHLTIAENREAALQADLFSAAT